MRTILKKRLRIVRIGVFYTFSIVLSFRMTNFED